MLVKFSCPRCSSEKNYARLQADQGWLAPPHGFKAHYICEWE